MFSCEEVFFEDDISSDTIEILSPTDNSRIEGTEITFYWNKLEGAASYRIEIARPDFSSGQYIINEEVDGVSYQTELPLGEYAWRVTALNSQYTSSYIERKFKLVDITEFYNRKVKVIKPTEDRLISNTIISDVSIAWNAVVDANLYRIKVENNNETISEFTTTDTIATITDFKEGLSIIKIRAENDSENTVYSDVAVLLDMVSPSTPILDSPENNTQIDQETEVNLSWSPEITTNIYSANEFDSLYLFYDINMKLLVRKERINNTEISYEFQRDSTYYWFVRRFDEAGNASDTSQVRKFSLK
ncbi:hypothetical protein [Zunongwangia sp.]|uniref:hypothetical protein n=1 Tax=Zunongwangia sp. TaxID=1965325 RepID=UPI003AA99285